MNTAQTAKKIASGVLIIPIMLLWILGITHILGGILLGSLVVGALFLTVEQVFGKWWWSFGTTKVGLIIVSLATSYLTHILVPGSHVTSLVAAIWALFAKALILTMVRKAEMQGDMRQAYAQEFVNKWGGNPAHI